MAHAAAPSASAPPRPETFSSETAGVASQPPHRPKQARKSLGDHDFFASTRAAKKPAELDQSAKTLDEAGKSAAQASAATGGDGSGKQPSTEDLVGGKVSDEVVDRMMAQLSVGQSRSGLPSMLNRLLGAPPIVVGAVGLVVVLIVVLILMGIAGLVL